MLSPLLFECLLVGEGALVSWLFECLYLYFSVLLYEAVIIFELSVFFVGVLLLFIWIYYLLNMLTMSLGSESYTEVQIFCRY